MTLEHIAPTVRTSPTRGRGYFWAALGLCLLGMALVVAQFSVSQLIVPWYLPVLTTLSACLLLWSLVQRRTAIRIVALALVTLLAGLQWYFLVSLTRLPDYEGPAQAGRALPDFEAKYADGRAFTERDLRDGTNSVLVFFRGRW